MANQTMEWANGFLDYVNASPTPFHAVRSSKERLEKVGFVGIRERDNWTKELKRGGKYYLTRNGSTIIAFAIGKKWEAGNGMALLGAHTDSPALRVKPKSRKFGESGSFLQVGVETYGGGLWHTWFDRDLGLAGRLIVKESDGTFVSKLVHIDRPILRIPTLAIHLDRQETFAFNKETQLFPIAGLAATALNKTPADNEKAKEHEKEEREGSGKDFAPLAAITERHHPAIVTKLAEAAGVSAENIMDFEILLFDTQKACLGGINDEFIFSARLDNLMMSYCATEGIIESLKAPDALDDETGIRLISLFDHEEIGSLTAQGANSNLLPAVVRRLSTLFGNADTSATAYEETLIKSMLWSCDQAHSVHPNYGAKYESDHRPAMNAGPVIKINANARYATNSPGIVLTQEVARGANVPLQLFVVRNDSSCGSTIGPMLSAALGTRTIDMGNAQLSMHSIRETGGSHDAEHAINLFSHYFSRYSELEDKILVH